MRTIAVFFIVFYFNILNTNAQLPYTQTQFAYDSLINVVYGTALDYGGNIDTLKMDIYKPVGDLNCSRPVIFLLHGGAWVVDSKENASMIYMSRQLAKMGWVVANINYRMGTHKATDYSMQFLCNTSISEPCAYVCDSAEVIRANFRAMQDAKGAIRFMKNRNEIDSSDINNVYIAGESAGAFTSFMVGFTDKLSEKPVCCSAIADAPSPSAYFTTHVCNQPPLNRTRPDLGDIEGSLNLGAFDAKVKGIGSFFGGVFDLNIFQQTDSTPCVYMFCQGSDVIVHYIYGSIFSRISTECYNVLCQPYGFYPKNYGNEGLRQYFVSVGSNSPVYQADIIDNYSLNNNCFENGHSIDTPQLRLQNMVNLFATKISTSGNNPQTNCQTNTISNLYNNSKVIIFQNPVDIDFNVQISTELKGSNYFITDQLGKILMTGKLMTEKSNINISNLSDGFYFLSIMNKNFKKTIKIVKQ